MAEKKTTKTPTKTPGEPVKEEVTREPHAKDDYFEYEVEAGVIRLPYMENLSRKDIKAAIVDDMISVDVLLEKFLREGQAEVGDTLTLWESADLTRKWNEASAIQLLEVFSSTA